MGSWAEWKVRMNGRLILMKGREEWKVNRNGRLEGM